MDASYNLKCRICQKEFPRFDQRGFRNAGFTAHQNRCIEKDYILNHPAPERHISPRQRLILPAPSTPSSSSNCTMLNPIYPSDTSTIQPTMLNYPPNQLQQNTFHYNNNGDNNNATNALTMNNTQAENIDASLFYHGNYFFENEIIFPVAHCVYCNPEFGLHQSFCLYFVQMLHQQQTPM